MPIPVDFEKSTLLRETFERVRKETAINILIKVLEASFSKPLPADLKDRLSTLTPEGLENAIGRLANADSLEEALARLSADQDG